GNVEHLAGNQAAHLGHHLATLVTGVGTVHDHGQGIDAIAVDKQVDAHDVGRPVFLELVVHRCVAARYRLELVEEVQNDLGQRYFVHQMHLAPMIGHIQLHAALDHAQRHDGPNVFLRHEQRYRDDGLAYLDDIADLGHARGALYHGYRPVALLDLVHHRRSGGDDVHIEFAL